MARPTKSKRMARSAIAALLAAIEIYNKPTVEYREQTFAILITNAWEVLLKAWIVQENDNELESIFDKDRNETIGLRQALGRTPVPKEVRENVLALSLVRNEAIHMGATPSNLQNQIRGFGTASIYNFSRLIRNWFKEPVPVSYLLPVGFLGESQLAIVTPSKSQIDLLRRLTEISASGESSDSEYAVTIHTQIQINPEMSGGGKIGITDDPNAPHVFLEPEKIRELYPHNHAAIQKMCKDRYTDFKINNQFHRIMNDLVKDNPRCTYHWISNPLSDTDNTVCCYNGDEVMKILDQYYSR